MYEEYLNNKFINATIMYVMFVVLCFILPPFFFFKFIYTFISYSPSEIAKMNGKVVLITGASSGIGEYIAYEYAKKEASLVLVARRESRLEQVAERARGLGSPDVLIQCADVSNVDDCRRFVDETINHFGRLDHLVNNAGITGVSTIEIDVTKFKSLMEINFWGSIYPTYFAIPHLKKSKGKVVVNSSASALLHPPNFSFYSASKAALVSFYEALRVELAPSITVTIVTLGYIDTEMIKGKFLSTEGVIKVHTQVKDAIRNTFPVMSTEPCAKAIVEGACKGERYITEPQFFRVFFMLKFLCPEIMDWFYINFFLNSKMVQSYNPNNLAAVPPSQTKEE